MWPGSAWSEPHEAMGFDTSNRAPQLLDWSGSVSAPAAQTAAGAAGRGAHAPAAGYAGSYSCRQAAAASMSAAPSRARDTTRSCGPAAVGAWQQPQQPQLPQPPLLGASSVAGYTPVITKSPISPSGYSINTALEQHASTRAAPAGRIAASSRVHPGSTATARTEATAASGPQQQQHQSAAARASHAAAGGSSSAAAAAAAAALAALGGARATASVGAAAYGQQQQQLQWAPQPAAAMPTSSQAFRAYDPDRYCASPPPAGNSVSLGRVWPLAAAATQPAAAAQQRPTYHAHSSNAAGVVSADSAWPGPPAGSSSGGGQMSAGLSKLKQLSSARLATRLTTPPAAAQGSLQGLGPALGGRAATAGAAIAPVLPATSQQQQQQQQQLGWGGSSGTRAVQRAAAAVAGRGGSSWASAAELPRGLSTGPQTQQQQQQPVFGAGASAGAWAEGGGDAAPRQQCSSCGRCFAAAALAKHAGVCAKVFGQRRKVFDMQAHRLQGTGAAVARAPSQLQGRARSAAGAAAGLAGGRQPAVSHDSRPAVSAAAAKRCKWKQQSEQLRAAMRATRPGGGGSTGGFGAAAGGYGGMPAAPAEEDTRVPCPHCGRRFAELVAERHIPKCSEIIAKPSGLRAGGGKAAYMRSGSGGRR